MKSIKLLAVAVLCTVAFSCNKKEETSEAKNLDSAQAETVVDALSQQENPADTEMLAEAKSKPLTTVAFSETEHNFGNIKKGEKVEHIYEVTNTGTNPLIISNVKPGCGCTAPDYTKEPIMPGQKGQITLKFDSTNFDGVVYKSAEVYANVAQVPIEIRFSADIQP